MAKISRTPRQAEQAFVKSVQRSLSCVTRAVLVTYSTNSSSLYAVDLGSRLVGDEPARLASDAGLALSATIHYRAVAAPDQRNAWITSIAAYWYDLLDQQGLEILAYHWHPESRSPIIIPHLHLGAGAQVGRHELIRSHLPTGLVTLESVLMLAIRDFDVRPLRTDWRDILQPDQYSVR